RRPLPAHRPQICLPQPLPRAPALHPAPWRLPPPCLGRARPRSPPRSLLHRLLLGTDGAAVRGRHHEPGLGRRHRWLRAGGEGAPRRPALRPPLRPRLRRLGPRPARALDVARAARPRPATGPRPTVPPPLPPPPPPAWP